jgi:DNA replication and repair protein RecF
MRVTRLRLTDFRNYRELDLPLARGLTIFTGRNAQGKSNVLEAVMIAATSRSFRTNTDREVVRWRAPGRFARVEATVERRADTVDVEVVIADTGGSPYPPDATAAPAAPFRKRIRINGTPRRAMDLIGMVTVVIFAPTDLDLVTGSPAERRRFLDMTLCQVRPAYCRALSQYQKVITQRGALLRRIRDGEESPHALGFWDEQLAKLAVPIMRERGAFLRYAESTAARVFARLAGADADDIPPLRLEYRPSYENALPEDDGAAVAAFRARLHDLRRRELAQGANVIGPHRDDLAFLADSIDLAVYGSRGQQRSVALALKLAELDFIEHETGDQPILLLDDVLSELDAQRRADLLASVSNLDQVLLTTTDVASVPPESLAGASVYAVSGGTVSPVDNR